MHKQEQPPRTTGYTLTIKLNHTYRPPVGGKVTGHKVSLRQVLQHHGPSALQRVHVGVIRSVAQVPPVILKQAVGRAEPADCCQGR